LVSFQEFISDYPSFFAEWQVANRHKIYFFLVCDALIFVGFLTAFAIRRNHDTPTKRIKTIIENFFGLVVVMPAICIFLESFRGWIAPTYPQLSFYILFAPFVIFLIALVIYFAVMFYKNQKIRLSGPWNGVSRNHFSVSRKPPPPSRQSTQPQAQTMTNAPQHTEARTPQTGMKPIRDPTDLKPLSDTLFEFGGSYIVLSILVGLCIINVIGIALDPFMHTILAALFGVGAFIYWNWHQRPRTIVSATKPPDTAPIAKPVSGNMRVDFQRREVVRKQKTGGLSSVTYNTFELIIQVQFSETALKIIHHANLMPYTLSKYAASMFDFTLEHKYDPPIVVADLVGKPLVIIRDSLPELNTMESQLREALKTLNEAIKTAGETQTTARETFEL
jgi:hypothetical protein